MFETSTIKQQCHSDKQQVCELSQLSHDLRRMLRVQVREFVHYIEDAEDGLGSTSSVIVVSGFEKSEDVAA